MDRGAYVLSTLIDLWSSLEHIELAHCGFSSSGIADLCLGLKHASCLQTLDLHGNRVQSAILQLIETLQQHIAIKRQFQFNFSSCDIPVKGKCAYHPWVDRSVHRFAPSVPSSFPFLPFPPTLMVVGRRIIVNPYPTPCERDDTSFPLSIIIHTRPHSTSIPPYILLSTSFFSSYWIQ
jgi:hypothetical protein